MQPATTSPPILTQKGVFQRPHSLAEFADLVELKGYDYSYLLRDFLDHFQISPTPACLEEEPVWFRNTENAVRRNAWMGAVAEHLSIRHGWRMPKWAAHPDRFLKRPWFVSNMKSLMAMELAQSPAAFRRRMIFAVEPLQRA